MNNTFHVTRALHDKITDSMFEYALVADLLLVLIPSPHVRLACETSSATVHKIVVLARLYALQR